MKKIINLLLLLIAICLITSCQSELLDEKGFGQIVVTGVEKMDNTPVSEAAIRIGDYTGSVGELMTVPTGIYDVRVTATIDGLNYGNTISGVVVETGETATISSVEIDVLSNAYRFIFDPEEYGVTVSDEVHLVGDLPAAAWDPANMSYPLIEQADGTWAANYDIDMGKEFKFIYDSTSWNGHDIGDNGSNYLVGECPGVTEAVLVWKFIFEPTEYGVTVDSEVHLVGNLPAATWDPANMSYSLVQQSDNSWAAYFDVEEGTEFKFIYDSTSWNGHDIGDNGSNFIVGQYPEVVTQNF
ncbi:MAG: hypothetical protein ACLFPF_07665 [Halanaerobiales bacterium]